VAPDITARAGALVGTGQRILWTRRYESQRAMASTTKVMTAIVVLENCSLDETVRITRAASRTPYKTGLRTGEKRSVRKLLELLLVGSSNDAATALAIHTGGSRRGFVRMMNKRAGQLAMTNTQFRNPHGLDASGHFSSAADLSKLMRFAVGNAEFRRIIRMRSVYLPRYRNRPARRIRSTDKLLGRVVGLRGGKTGYTNDARYCFVASARRDGVTLTSVVLGSSSSYARFASSRRLLEWGFKHYRYKPVCSSLTRVGAVPTSVNPTATVSARCAQSRAAGVLDLLGAPTRYVSLQTTIAVPVFAGQKLGVVRYLQGSEVIASVDAVAAGSRASAEETIGTVPVSGSVETSIVVKAAPSTAAVKPFDVTKQIEHSVTLPPMIAAPVQVGQVVGGIVYRQNGVVLVSVPVVASTTAGASGP
jgi:D-alanyl-D-alanine carboxypeptidase (penicillin-binding protein 5/6)